MSDEDRIAQLSEAASQTAAVVETQGARLVDVQARIQELDDLVRGLRATHSDTSERVERVAAELDVSAQIASLSAQLEAARTAQLQTAERLEAVASTLDRIDTLEGALAHSSREAAASLDEREASLRAEVRAVAERQSSERDETGRAVSGVVERLGALATLDDRLGSAERRVMDAEASHGRLVARVEEIAAERQNVEEAVLQADRRQQSRIEALNDELASLKDEIGTWRDRIDAQTETVREARAVSDEMSEQAKGLREAHHSTEEAQRVAEDRVDSELAAMRSESAETWERFRQERHNEWQALDQARGERGVAIEAQAAELLELAEALDGSTKMLAGQLHDQSSALAALRRELAEVLSVWRDGLADATEIIESGLPSAERTAQQAERREATRRALRAQRDSRE